MPWWDISHAKRSYSSGPGSVNTPENVHSQEEKRPKMSQSSKSYSGHISIKSPKDVHGQEEQRPAHPTANLDFLPEPSDPDGLVAKQAKYDAARQDSEPPEPRTPAGLSMLDAKKFRLVRESKALLDAMLKERIDAPDDDMREWREGFLGEPDFLDMPLFYEVELERLREEMLALGFENLL